MNAIGIYGSILGALEWRRLAHRLLIGATVSLMLVPVAQAATDMGAEDSLPPPAHADRDGDGLSDALQNKIDGKANREKIAVVVTFDGPGNVASTQAAVGPFAVKRAFTTIRGFAATMTVGQARALTATPGIFRVEEDFVATINMAEARADYGADAAQASGYDGSGVAICVVDTGLDGNHLDLAGKIDGFCNALAGGCTVNADGLATDNTAPFDDNDHGTHVGGIAAGAGNAQSQYRGIAPAARLYGAKVCNSGGSCFESDIVAGISWCAGQPAVRVMNVSLGSPANGDGNSAISLAADCAVDASSHPGICINYPNRTPKIVVVAAGNAGAFVHTVGEPGAAREVITVGALGTASVSEEWADRRGHGVVAFSSRGPTADHRTKPDITAPGAGITAPDAGTVNGYQTFSGTSMASPFTAGTMALMTQARLQSMSRPPTDPLDATDVVQLKNVLYNTAQDRGPAGQDDDWGHGAIDTLNAVLTAGGNPPVPNTFAATEFFTPLIQDASDWIHPINVDAADVGKSLLVTILNPSFDECIYWVGSECWIWDVITTNFDVLLWDPNGILIDMSACPGGENPNNGSMDPADPTVTYCGVSGRGRQETLYTTTDTAGAYTLRIFPWNGDGYDNVPSATPEVVIALSGSATSLPDTTAPIVTAGANQVGDEGTMIAISATFTDSTAGDTHSATIDWGDGTSDTVINPAMSPLASAHSYADNGIYIVTITVTDAANNAHGDTLAVTVNNAAPTVNAGADETVAAGTLLTINPTFTDPGSADTHSAAVIWSDGTVDNINPATSPLSLGHTYTVAGSYSVSVTVTDKDGDAHTDTLSVTVNPAGSNLPPTVTAPADVTVVATALLTPVNLGTATVTDPEGESLTATPDNAGPYPVGTTVVTWSATDSAGNTGTDIQNVTVTPLTNTPPTAVDNLATLGNGRSTTIAVMANDSDPDAGDVISLLSVGLPSNGVVTANADGTINYRRNKNYKVGCDSFGYTIADLANATGSGTVFVEVGGASCGGGGGPVVASDDGYTTPQGTPLDESAPGVLANDSGGVAGLTASPVGQFATIMGGTVTLSSDGSFVYTPPTATFTGSDIFTYTASDGITSDPAAVTIEVIGGGGGTVSVSTITFSVKGRGLTGTVTVDPTVSSVVVEVSFCRPGACLFDHVTAATNNKGKSNFKIVGFVSGLPYTLTVHSLTVDGTTRACDPTTETCVASTTP